MRTILALKLILANLFLRSAHCAFDDDQYSIFRDKLNGARNELQPIGEFLPEEEIHSSSISNINEAVSISEIYSTLVFESRKSLPLTLEDIAIHGPNVASPSESTKSASAKVDIGLEDPHSYDMNPFQEVNLIAEDDKSTPMMASSEIKVPIAAAGPAKYPTVDSKPEASIAEIKLPAPVIGGANKHVRRPIAPALNKRTVPKPNNKPTGRAINNRLVMPVIKKRADTPVINNNQAVPVQNNVPAINNNPAVPVQNNVPVINNNPAAPAQNEVTAINNDPAAPAQTNAPFVSVVHYKPIASAIKNRPIPSIVNNSPTIPVNAHEPTPIALTAQQSLVPSANTINPIVSGIQQEPAPSSMPIQQASAAAPSIIQLKINTTAEQQIQPCYRDNRKVPFSQYWIPRQNEWDETNEGNRVFLNGNILRRMNDKDGGELGWIPVEMYDKCRMEGTCMLDNGDLVNIDDSTDTFIKIGGPGRRDNIFGLGSGSQNLVPFISVAANDLPLGQKLYIPELDGVNLGGGMVHNGCVRVDDDSWSFGSCQLDFFVLSYVDYLWLRLGEQVSVRSEDCQLKNYINKYHLAMMKASMDEKIIPSLLDAKYVPL